MGALLRIGVIATCVIVCWLAVLGKPDATAIPVFVAVGLIGGALVNRWWGPALALLWVIVGAVADTGSQDSRLGLIYFFGVIAGLHAVIFGVGVALRRLGGYIAARRPAISSSSG